MNLVGMLCCGGAAAYYVFNGDFEKGAYWLGLAIVFQNTLNFSKLQEEIRSRG